MTHRFLLLSLAISSTATAAPIIIDGNFDDWEEITPLLIDPSGDANPNTPDLLSLSAAKSDDTLYIAFEVDREMLLQETPDGSTGVGNSIVVTIDGGDGGSQMTLELGNRQLTITNNGATITPTFAQTGFYSAPTHTSQQFELSIPFTASPLGEEITLIAGDTPRFYLSSNNSGDRMPDSGFAEAGPETAINGELDVISLEKMGESDVRVLSYNVLRDRPFENPDPFVRILQATKPDILAFQEMWEASAEDARQFVADAIPLPRGEFWFAAKNDDCITVSRYPILTNASITGNLVSLIDLPDALSPRDLVVFNVHSPCCTNNAGRDFEHDEVSATWRDLLNGTGPFSIQADTAMISTGDFNMVGFVHQRETVQDGSIIDPQNFGPDYSPNRKLGSLDAVIYRHTHQAAAFTWFSLNERFYPGLLDWTFYTSDVMTLRNHYGLFTPVIPAATLQENGLQAADSLESDHLPLIADFSFPEEQFTTWSIY